MRKDEFLQELRDGLTGLPQNELEKRIAFYAEMIDDRMEDGLSEAQAVEAVGTVSEIIMQVVEEYPHPEQIQLRVHTKRKLSASAILLIVLGAPVWLPLLIAAFAVAVALWAVLWSVILSLWAVFAALVGGAAGGVVGGIFFACTGYAYAGTATIGAGLVCGGVALFALLGCKAATIGAALLTKKAVLGIKRICTRKGEA